MLCKFAQRSEEAYQIAVGKETRIEGPMLCNWADSAPQQLVGVPRWLQRNALSGHLLKYPDDCMGCPCYQPED